MDIRWPEEPKLSPSGKEEWRFIDDWYIWIDDKLIVVPKGFISDGASVPRLPIVYAVAGGKMRRASFLHDWMYFIGWPKKYSDEVFFWAMQAEGINKSLRNTAYRLVKLAGHAAYNRHRRAESALLRAEWDQEQ